MKEFKYIIIGNSAAGIAAAEAIRNKDQKGSVAIFSDEPYAAYGRPLISEYLSSRCSMSRMLYRPSDFYQKIQVQIFLNQAVSAIDLSAKTVSTNQGEVFSYEKLLIATGGKPIMPPIKGLQQKGVYTFTKLDDAITLDALINNNQKAVIIGGGLIGLSLAEALVKRNVDVTVVEMKDRVLNTILDTQAAAIVKERINQYGIKVMVNSTVTEVTEDPIRMGVAGGVIVDNKINIKADLVCAAIGVAPRLDIAKAAGIKCNRGILVDRQMKTSQADVYAAGDVVEAYDYINQNDSVIPVWPNAYWQGRIAGLNMAGFPADYEGGTVLNALKYFKLAITTAGLVTPPDQSYEVIQSQTAEILHRLILKDGKIVGFSFVGEVERSGMVYQLMKRRVDVSNFKEKLVAPNLELLSLPDQIWQRALDRTLAKK